MKRCLISEHLFNSDDALLDGDIAHHLCTVLRVAPGERLSLLDGKGHRKETVVTEVSRHAVRVQACGAVETVPRARPEITLFQSVIKNARMDWVIEKAVELGVTRLIPVMTRRCVVKHKEGVVNDRWQRLADSALEQCDGAWRMTVAPVSVFASALHLMRDVSSMFVASLSPGAKPMRDVLPDEPPERIGWHVGPEGDFTDEEMDALCSMSAIPVTLGRNILRSETAAMFGLSVIKANYKL